MSERDGVGIEDIVRRNIAELRGRANLTQQGLADELYRRGVGWTRETVAQAETGTRRLGLTEAVAVAAALDVPLARLLATPLSRVQVGERPWSASYLTAAVAGTAGASFDDDAFGSAVLNGRGDGNDDLRRRRPVPQWLDDESEMARTTPLDDDGDVEPLQERRRRPRNRQRFEAPDLPGPGSMGEAPRSRIDERSPNPQRTAERIQRRLRMRVTADDIEDTAFRLWSRSLDAEHERRVNDRYSLTGGSLSTIRGHVSRELDREIEHDLTRSSAAGPEEAPVARSNDGLRRRSDRSARFQDDDGDRRQRSERVSRNPGQERHTIDTDQRWSAEDAPRGRAETPWSAPPRSTRSRDLTPDDIGWEATRLHMLLSNKGYNDSVVTRWWNFEHQEALGGQTIAEAWRDGRYDEVRTFIEGLADRRTNPSGLS